MRAAVEFGKGIVVVPVVIVYTDKSRYRSRVRCYFFVEFCLLFIGVCRSSLGAPSLSFLRAPNRYHNMALKSTYPRHHRKTETPKRWQNK